MVGPGGSGGSVAKASEAANGRVFEIPCPLPERPLSSSAIRLVLQSCSADQPGELRVRLTEAVDCPPLVSLLLLLLPRKNSVLALCERPKEQRGAAIDARLLLLSKPSLHLASMIS